MIVRSFSISIASIILAFATTPSRARADLVIYHTASSFKAAAANLTTISFENIAPPVSFVKEPSPPGLTINNVSFTIDRSSNNNGSLYVVGQDYYYPGASALSSQSSSIADNNIVITLPKPTTALGLNIGSFFGSAFIFRLSNGGEFSEFAPTISNGLEFVGVTSTQAFSSLTISAPSFDVLNINNVSYGVVTAVPEPNLFASMIFTIPCLAFYLFARRTRRMNRIILPL